QSARTRHSPVDKVISKTPRAPSSPNCEVTSSCALATIRAARWLASRDIFLYDSVLHLRTHSRRHHGRRRGHATLSADQGTVEAGCATRWQIPDRRYPDLELH